MKRSIFLLMSISSLIGMQQPNRIVENFYQAIRDGNVATVVQLISNPQVQQAIKTHKYFATEAVIKFPPRVPARTADYMRIARILKNAGALMDERAEVVMVDYEKKHTPPLAPTKPAQPSVAPVTKPARPLPVTPPFTPIVKPADKPGNGKTPVVFEELREITRSGDFEKTKAYLDTHNIGNLTAAQKEEIIRNPINNLSASGPITPEILHRYRRTIALLQKNGFEIKGTERYTYARTQKGDFGARAGLVESLLNIAIKNKDLNRIKQLVEQENADVNATDTMGLSPLIFAAKVDAEDIAKYLYSQGARLYENNYYENRQFKPVLQKWGIPVN